jgi:hypothetical protein
MCGRYVSVKARADLLTEVRAEGPELRESYNVAVSGSAAWQSVPRDMCAERWLRVLVIGRLFEPDTGYQARRDEQRRAAPCVAVRTAIGS